MLNNFITVMAWVGSHAGLVAAYFVFVLAFAFIIAAAIEKMAGAKRRREARTRARLDKIMQASHAPKAPGFNSRKVS